MNRGAIRLANLDPPPGSEGKKTRPAVIVSRQRE
ncbi:MAG: type II toxin-antitoxin system PemK/MazF family toxin [Verrucomicrobia bacterium]|nr:type II toxin-antitoxin system PemK/MazF family toxin [Verrucomicrobiota bacterium]